MTPPPLLNSPDLLRSPEVVAVLRLMAPSTLAGQAAGLPTIQARAVALAPTVPVVGNKQLPATKALTTAGLDAHVEPNREENPGAVNQNHAAKQQENGRRKKGLRRNPRKKTPRKNTNFSTAGFLKFQSAADIGQTSHFM